VACLRRAYLEFHSPELAKPLTVAEQERMRAGVEVGRLARKMFEGVLIEQPSTDMMLAASDTRHAIAGGAGAVFEAAFLTEMAAVRVDILERLPSGNWHIIEVKSSKEPKDEYLSDVAFQRIALTDAGFEVERCSLLLISDGFVFKGNPIDPREFFVMNDVSEVTGLMAEQVRSQIGRHISAVREPEPPEVVPNVHCKRDGECPFLRHCWSGLPLHDVTTLPLVRAEIVHEMHERGTRDIAMIPSSAKLSARQRLIAGVVRSGVSFVSPDLEGILAAVKYPVHFIDFEASTSAIPSHAGIAPYRHVPFQWSDHVLESDGVVRHLEFLHREKSDPRGEFARTLIEALQGAGTVAFYSSYEKSILRGLAKDGTPFAQESLDLIEQKGLDLEKVVREHVYLPDFMGRTSIKKVYPALVQGEGYRGLAIQDGETAAAEYKRMFSSATTPYQAQAIASDLLQYCERDTLAMVEVFRALCEIAKHPSSPAD
jgi:predicted RecB family nuclease